MVPFSLIQNTVLVKNGNTTISLKEMQQLGQCHMPVNIMNLYMDLLETAAGKLRKKVLCIKNYHEIENGYTNVHGYDYVIVPIDIGDNYWFLAIGDVDQKKLHYLNYDLGVEVAGAAVLNSLPNYLQKGRSMRVAAGSRIEWTVVWNNFSTNKKNSGAIVCWAANYFVRHREMPAVPKNIDFTNHNHRIRYEVMHLRIMN